MTELATYLESRRAEVEEALRRVLPPEGSGPPELVDAMRYSTLAGGKRIRPILVLASAETCGIRTSDVPRAELVEAACSLELIHTYSLIHDDLPCMDDDQLRRGKPTCHVVFGEAMALLAGDSLQSLGFEVLATRPGDSSISGRRAEAVALVATSIGHDGMAGGQALDILATGRLGSGALDESLLRSMHAKKTGSLIRASIELGAVYAGAEASRRLGLRRYGEGLGLVFQIADDILDVTADAGTLGKTAGKDAAQSKLTYPSLFGLEEARRRLDLALDSTLLAAQDSGDPEGILQALARFAARRDR